ncbi:MAG: PD40 domain-containing protein [Armatimonadetes bacterium]|nr:PD40 domain-containing protein [Armatimonadota bacterium]MDE2207216.1 PD40 domain-containing protein [Armatimonadota bacterium]
MKRQIAALLGLAAALAAVAAHAQNADPGRQRLARMPDISKTSIVFVYGGDLWLVSRNGGTARRLTASPGPKAFPKFSPDGKWIAFSAQYDGIAAVYIIPSTGGDPIQLTYHPTPSIVDGWTPDSKAVLFRSGREAHSYRYQQLFTVPVTGGLATRLPIPTGGLASYSPHGNQIAYNAISSEFATWKRYRGGEQSYVSVFNLVTHQYYEVPHGAEEAAFPMWSGGHIYFLSDKTETKNLYDFNVQTRQTRPLTHYQGYDVDFPSCGAGAIVFQHGGHLNVLNTATGHVRTVDIKIYSDNVSARPEWINVSGQISAASLSPSAKRVAFVAHGEIFTVPAKHGATRDISNTPGAREVEAAWSPDGKRIAYFSDATGEYELYTRPADGTGGPTRLTFDGHNWRSNIVWSPDSQSLLYRGASGALYLVGADGKKAILVDHLVSHVSTDSWSADSKWIAYCKSGSNLYSNIWLYSVEQQKSFRVSDGTYDDSDPVFDRSGKYLFFTSDRHFSPSNNGLETAISVPHPGGLYLLTLAAATPSPFAPRDDEEGATPAKPAPVTPPKPATPANDKKVAPKPVNIDLQGLYQRIVALPVAKGDFGNLQTGSGKLFYVEGAAIHLYDLSDRTDKVVMPGAQSYVLNADASKLLYQAGGGWGIVPATAGHTAAEGKVAVDLQMRTVPREEWPEILRDAWRFERDFYYNPAMHGLNWQGMYKKYAALVPEIADRSDLTYLIGQLIGELDTSHSYVFGTAGPPVPHVSVGLLGVDFEAAGKYYRIARILPGHNWNPALVSPLTEPGIKVAAGDYLLAVNGSPLTTTESPYEPFQNTVGVVTDLRVNSAPTDAGAWDIKVKPIASEGALRNLVWVEHNRELVSKATGGRIGYIYVPDTAGPGMTAFAEGFYAQTNKQGLIVDERFNSGGDIPDFYIQKLDRKRLSIFTERYGPDIGTPTAAIYGPKCIMTNEWSGSGGDAFPYFFREAGIGPVIGRRTWGGLVGYMGPRTLMDGGGVTVPQFGLWDPHTGKWIAENHGIDPDIDVQNTPDKTINGGDPQLQAAIKYELQQLKLHPTPKYVHPPFSVDNLPAQDAVP